MAAIDAVAPDLDASVRAAAMETLLAVARVHAPYLVAEKGRDLVLRFRPCEPDIPAEDVSRNSLELSRTRSGRIRLVGDLDAVTGEMLSVALSPLSKPAPAADGTPDERTPAQRRADGLTRLLELYLAAGTGPSEGGVRPHIVLTVNARDLAAARADATGAGSTDTHADTPTTHTGVPEADASTTGAGASATVTDASATGAPDPDPGVPGTDTSTSVSGTDTSSTGSGADTGVPEADASTTGTGTDADAAETDSRTGGTGSDAGEAARSAAGSETAETDADTDAPATARDATPDPARFCEPAPFRLEWMGAISTELAQMLACDCTITSIVLDDHEVPLKLGRTQRLVPPSLRRAVVARDVGCVRCGAPAAWSQCHHIVAWSEGGPTDLANIALVCGRCHRELHRGYWDLTIGPDGHVWIIPPKRIDEHRRPVPGFFRRAQQEEVA